MIAKILAISCFLAICQCQPEGRSDSDEDYRIFGPSPTEGTRMKPAISTSLADESFRPKPINKRQAEDQIPGTATGETCTINGNKGKCIPYFNCKPSQKYVSYNCPQAVEICCEDSNMYSEKELDDMKKAWEKKKAEQTTKKE